MPVAADPDAMRKARESKRLSRPIAARKSQLSVSMIRALERGRRQPSIDTAFKLSKAYGCTLDELLKDRGEA